MRSELDWMGHFKVGWELQAQQPHSVHLPCWPQQSQAVYPQGLPRSRREPGGESRTKRERIRRVSHCTRFGQRPSLPPLSWRH